MNGRISVDLLTIYPMDELNYVSGAFGQLIQTLCVQSSTAGGGAMVDGDCYE